MHLVQLLLPLYDNDQQPFGRSALDQVRDELAQRFGGVTAFRRSPAEGVWEEGRDRRVSRDQVVIYEVMTERIDRDWWTNYRRELERRFRQERILIRATETELL